MTEDGTLSKEQRVMEAAEKLQIAVQHVNRLLEAKVQGYPYLDNPDFPSWKEEWRARYASLDQAMRLYDAEQLFDTDE
jgi:hypothetical protein